MTYSPQTTEEVKDSLENSLIGKIAKLTNFTEGSFNNLFVSAVSTYFRELELKLLASELSGYVAYAGGPITNEDLRRLEIEDSVSAGELNQYMDDEQLDNLVEVVGITRDSGNKATGFVDISTSISDSVTIPSGTVVTTDVNSSSQTLEYETTEERISASGQGEIIDIPVRATDVGNEYNIPANEIIRLASPPIGTRGVASSTTMDGGSGVETNSALRERAQNKFSEEPTGGTTRGIRGYIIDEIESVESDDIGITELFDREPVVVEVTVDGGSSSSIETAIEESRPVGVKHELIRPKIVSLSVDAQVLGDEVDRVFASSEIEDYLADGLVVGDSFYKRDLIREILNSDTNILNIDMIEVRIDTVSNERNEYISTQNIYELDFNHDGGEFTLYANEDDGTQTIFEQGTDYQLIDSGGDGLYDKIEWLGVTEPTDGQNFYADYTVYQETNNISDEEHIFVNPYSDTITYDDNIEEYKLTEIPTESTLSITDQTGATYTKDTDYELINTSIGSNTNNFVYSSGRSRYELNNSAFGPSVTVSIPDSTTFTQGTDYQVIDDDADGIVETIEWLDDGTTPADNEEFVVEYDIDNGLPQTVRWLSGGTSPADGDTFTVEYEKQVYELDNEIDVVTPDSVSCNCDTSTYELGTDFKFVDVNADTEKDAIYWIDGGDSTTDGNPFFVTYQSEGDISITEQEKIGVSTVTITET